MAAYFILTHTITDIERYREEYIPQVIPFIAKWFYDFPRNKLYEIL